MSEASNKHYSENKDYYYKRNKARREEFRKIVFEHRNQPCFDCGIKYPFYVMQFDHTRGIKKFNVCDIGKPSSKQDLLNEIAKCDVVCANCHCIRTYERKQCSLGELADPVVFGTTHFLVRIQGEQQV